MSSRRSSKRHTTTATADEHDDAHTATNNTTRRNKESSREAQQRTQNGNTRTTAATDSAAIHIAEYHGEQKTPYSFILNANDSSSSSFTASPLLRSFTLSSFTSFLRSLFLPLGYPHSVPVDYLRFQVWDTLQAMCSYLRGMMCTAAVLSGLGVGDTAASATNATLNWVLRDGVGMMGGLVFAWGGGREFGANLRSWRLFADVINDVGLTLELISPFFPKEYFLYFLSLGCICRSMCGVSAGATRAALMQHFALEGNVADLSAKEGIQETFVTLCGMLAGSVAISYIDGQVAHTWILFLLLTALHVYANYKAVTGLVLNTLNDARAEIIIRHQLQHYSPKRNFSIQLPLTPMQVAPIDPLLPWHVRSILLSLPWPFSCCSSFFLSHPLSLPLSPFLSDDAVPVRIGVAAHEALGGGRWSNRQIKQLLFDPQRTEGEARDLPFILAPRFSHSLPSSASSSSSDSPSLLSIDVVLSPSSTALHPLHALFSAHLFLFLWRSHSSSSSSSSLSLTDDLLSSTLRQTSIIANQHFPLFVTELTRQGWKLQHLLISSGEWRCQFDEQTAVASKRQHK